MTKHMSVLDSNIPIKKCKLEEGVERLEKTYEKMLDFYTKDGLTQHILIFLKLIASCSLVPSELKSLPLLRMLEETCKDFLLNDLEVIVWNIFLEKVVWSDRTKKIQVLFLYSAYAAKINLNESEDLLAIKSYISSKHPGFLIGYDKWFSLHRERLQLSLRGLNQAFNSFLYSPDQVLVDYNYYVDDLLQIAPPSGICEKEAKLDFTEEPEEAKIPDLLNLNSVFETADNLPPLLLSRTISLDANRELGLEPLGDYGIESPLKPLTEELY